MKKSILVIGAGRFGRGVIEGLYERGHDIVAINQNEDALELVRDMLVSGVIMNVSEEDEKLAKLVEEKNFDEAVVAIGEDFEASLMATQVLKEANITVSVKAASQRQANVLLKLGADRIVFPERDMGLRLAQQLSTESEIDVLELPQDFIVEQLEVGNGFHGKTVGNLNTTNRFGIYLLLIYKGEQAVLPNASTKLHKGDVIVVFGKKESFTNFEKENFS